MEKNMKNIAEHEFMIVKVGDTYQVIRIDGLFPGRLHHETKTEEGAIQYAKTNGKLRQTNK